MIQEQERLAVESGWVELDPATDFADIPRDEKQMAYELWRDAQPVESKAQRRMRRGRLKKWVLRHSQIKAAAKQHGPRVFGYPRHQEAA